MPLYRYTRRMLHVAGAVALLLGTGLAVSAEAQAVTLVPNATRFAGIGAGSSGYNGDFGSAGTLALNQPAAVAFDGLGNLLIADRANNCVRREDSTQLHFVTTIAGLQAGGLGDTCNRALNASPSPAQGLIGPAGVAADSVGNVYISDTGHNCVRLLPSGASGVSALQTVAGTCGAATLGSTTPTPTGLAVDERGNLYITIRDTSDGIYQVLRHDRNSAAGSLCRVAGNASSQGVVMCSDVAGTVALLAPAGVALDGVSDLYIADQGNNCVRKLHAGTFSVALGTCGSNASVIPGPTGLAFSLAGNLFVSLSATNRIFRYNQGTDALTLVAGNANGLPGGYSGSQDGVAASALPLNAPGGIAEDSSNNLYVADTGNSIVRELTFGNIFPQTATGQSSAQQMLTFQINTASNLTVTAGTDYAIAAGDTCNGAQSPAPAGSTSAYCSIGIIFTPTQPGPRNSALTVTDSLSGSVVTAGLQGTGIGPQGLLFSGVSSTFAVGLNTIRAITQDAANNIYALSSTTDTDAQLLRFPPGGGAPDVIIAAGAGMRHPVSVAIDAGGNIFIADTVGSSTGGPTIQRYGADGSVNVDFQTNIQTPRGIYVDGFGNLIIAEQGTANDVLKIFAGGERRVLIGGGTQPPVDGAVATSVQLGAPTGVVISPNGTLYATDAGTHRVYSIDAGGLLHIVAGSGDTAVNDSTTALGQNLITPTNIEVDAAGDLFITDSDANKVFIIFASASSSDSLRRLAGRRDALPGATGDGGTAANAALRDPQGVAVTPEGNVYIADSGNGKLREVTFPSSTLTFGSRAVNSNLTGTTPFLNNGNSNLLRPTAPAISDPAFTNAPSVTSCGSAIIPGLLCNFGFTFHPTALTAYNATASINDNAPSSPQIMNLIGEGGVPAITRFEAMPNPETTQYGGPYVATLFIDNNGGVTPSGTFTFTIDTTVTCSVTTTVLGLLSCTLPDGGGLSVGVHAVHITLTNSNYPDQAADTTLTVKPRALTEQVNSKSKAYLAPVPTLDGAPNGFLAGVNGDGFTITYSTSVTAATLPGTYVGAITATATPTPGTLAFNYDVAIVKGDFAVTQAALTGFGASPESGVYGGTFTGAVGFTPTGGVAPTGNVVFRTGTVTLCTVAVSANAVCNGGSTGLPVGTYPVSVTYPGDANYTAVTVATTLIVTPAPLAVVVDNKSKTFGGPVPALTGSVNGLVAGDTLGGSITVAYSTTVTPATPVGTYPNSITATVGGTGAGNYTVSVQPGSFSVTATPSTSTLLTATPTSTAGAPVTFNVRIVSSTGAVPDGAVTFTADGVLLGSATLDASGNATFTTSALAAGSRTIVANYAGNAAFGPSSASITQAVTVPVGSLKIVATPDAQFIRGPGDMQFGISVTSLNGYVGSVTLTCSGLPADAKCVFKNGTLTLTANATVSTTFTTTTTNADATVAGLTMPQMQRGWPVSAGIAAAAALPMQLSGLGLIAAGFRRRKSIPRGRWLMMLAVTLGALCLAGCGCPDTAFHTYPIVVTATPSNGGPNPVSAVVYLAVGHTN